MFNHSNVKALPRGRLKRDRWKVGIALAGMLLLLVLMVWVPVSAADAQERVSGLAAPTTGTVQTTPTVGATATPLSKEQLEKAKLEQEITQLKNQNKQFENQNQPDIGVWLRTGAFVWLRTNIAVILGLLGGAFGLWRWFVDQSNERKKRAEERFQAAATGLGDEKEGAKIGAAIALRTFLRPGYKQFSKQTFDLAAANLRLPRTTTTRLPRTTTTRRSKGAFVGSSVAHYPPEDLTPPPFSLVLIDVFKEAFPLAREWVKQGSGSTHFQQFKASLKPILRKEELFDPRSLNASHINLDKAFLWKADLEQVYMPWASLQGTDLSEANLRGAWLWRSNLSEAKLVKANLSKADLGQVTLTDAQLTDAKLRHAKLWGADLRRADLGGAEYLRTNLGGADFGGADLRGVKGLTKDQLIGYKDKGAIIDEGSTTSPPRSPVAPLIRVGDA